MPKAFFPDKTEINDSERTRLYTGRYVSGSETGTSISLGWMAEVYIDFGKIGMMAAALVTGGFYGIVYAAFARWHRSTDLLGFSLACAVLLPASLLETSITKMFGGVIVASLVAALVARFVVPVTAPWLVHSGRRV
jgi:hypothetical protein